jgi:hypothetical protein
MAVFGSMPGLIAQMSIGPLTVLRATAPTQNERGGFDPGDIEDGELNPVAVHTVSGRELEQVPEADRHRETIRVYTVERLHVTDDGQSSDRIVYDGRLYRVTASENYGPQGDVYMALAVLDDIADWETLMAGYKTIQISGVALPQRDTVNFEGAEGTDDGEVTTVVVPGAPEDRLLPEDAGADGEVLTVVDGAAEWAPAPSGGGSGVSESTDNAIARFDGTAGALQNSGVTINDAGLVETPSQFRVRHDADRSMAALCYGDNQNTHDPDGESNLTMHWGYNIAPNGNRLNSAKHAAYATIESRWVPGVGQNPIAEWHWQYIGADGTARRPLSMQVNLVTHTTGIGVFGPFGIGNATNSFTRINFTASDTNCFVGQNGVANGAGGAYSFFFDVNNRGMFSCRNAASNAWVECLRLDASDWVTLGAGAVAGARSDKPFRLPSYTVAQANELTPTQKAAGAMIYVSNGNAGTACLAVSDGTNWKVVALGATISAS